MRARLNIRRLVVATSLVAATGGVGVVHSASGTTTVFAGPTPGVACDSGSHPEQMQGRAPAADVATGRAALGYTCNARAVGHAGGQTGGYRVERFVDKAGHVCAFWDSTLLFPTAAIDQGSDTTGTYVMDMADPAHPVHTDTLRTPAFQTPHESVRLNQKRGLLAAVAANPAAYPGVVDVYDVNTDCRHPVPKSSTPLGILGHESGFAPDGLTFYVASAGGQTLAAIDLSNPVLPNLLWMSRDYTPHGVSISEDGNRLYMADIGSPGMTVLDVSQIQKRAANPTVKVLSRLTWPEVSIPQNATPFTRKGHKYLLETDEFGERKTGAARIINIDNDKKPFVASNLRLAVNQPGNYDALQGDPGNDQAFQGYQGHYCTVPSRVDPNIVACSFILSGLRVFDIRNPAKPREVAYFSKPMIAGDNFNPDRAGAFAMSAPAYDHARNDIWYSDGTTGFWVVHMTKGAGVPSFARTAVLPGS